jgi:hypothetical protein
MEQPKFVDNIRKRNTHSAESVAPPNEHQIVDHRRRERVSVKPRFISLSLKSLAVATATLLASAGVVYATLTFTGNSISSDQSLNLTGVSTLTVSSTATFNGNVAMKGPGPWFDVTAYGAKPDAIFQSGGASINSGTNTLTCTGCSFTSTAVDGGKAIVVSGAGVAGANLSTSIVTVTDSTHAVLAANAATTVTNGGPIYYGTDDATAIQNAVNTLPAEGSSTIGGGGTLYIPCGNYIVSSGIVFTHGNSSVKAGAPFCAVFYPTATVTTGVWQFGSNSTSPRYLKVENIGIYCNSFPSLDGFTMNQVTNTDFINDTVAFCRNGASTVGIDPPGSNAITFYHGSYDHNSSNGILGSKSANNWNIIGTQLSYNGLSAADIDGGALLVIGVDAESNSGNGIFLNDSSGDGIGASSITGNYFENNTNADIRLGTQGVNGQVAAVFIGGNYHQALATTQFGIDCRYADGVTIQNEEFEDFTGSSVNTIRGLVDGANQGCDNISVSNNNSQGGTTVAQSLLGSHNTTLIGGNFVSGDSVSVVSATVASLPAAAAGNKGQMRVVSDSTAVASEGQTCVGSSSTTALAFSNGSIWKCF